MNDYGDSMITIATVILKRLGHKLTDWKLSGISIGMSITHVSKCLTCHTQFGIQSAGDSEIKLSHVQMTDVRTFTHNPLIAEMDQKSVMQRPVITTIWESHMDQKPDPFFICERLKVLT